MHQDYLSNRIKAEFTELVQMLTQEEFSSLSPDVQEQIVYIETLINQSRDCPNGQVVA